MASPSAGKGAYSYGARTPGPIFIGGDHRSGTTLLSVMLDAHPDAVCGPEIDFLDPPNLGPHVLECIRLLAAADPAVLGAGVDTADPRWQPGVQFVKQCHRFGIEPGELRAVVAEQVRESGSDIATFDARCGLMDRLGEFRRRTAGTPRWGLKIQRLVADCGSLARQWPAARFVHVVRDGRDVAASHLCSPWSWAYHDIAEAARGWADIVGRAHRSLPSGRSIEVRYEDVVHDPRSTLHAVLDAVGLPWNDAVLGYARVGHSLHEHPYEHPSATAVGSEINDRAVGRYRRDLTSAQVAEFERIAGHVLEELGYVPVSARQEVEPSS